MPRQVCVRPLVPKLKNSSDRAISSARLGEADAVQQPGRRDQALARAWRLGRKAVAVLPERPCFAWPCVARKADDAFTRGITGPAEISQSASISTAFISQSLVGGVPVFILSSFPKLCLVIFRSQIVWPVLR